MVPTIVVVSDRLAYAGGVALADFSRRSAGLAGVTIDAIVGQHRNAGDWVVDRRREAGVAA